MNYIEKLKELSINITHGNSSYFEHCIGVYNILKNINAPEDICISGLYHSVYDTENFNANIKVTRDEVKNIIGEFSEDLVFKFCNLKNRYNIILNNSFNFNEYTHNALMLIEYANLKEQSERIDDQILVARCLQLQEKINKKMYEKIDSNLYFVDNKKLYVFDNLLEKNHIDFLNQYCYNSLYKPNHKSNNSAGIDSRFASFISIEEFKETKLLPIINKIANILNEDLYIGTHYINHYSLMTSSSEHCDGDSEGQYTILIFPNNVWGKNWGGEIVFYNNKNNHTMMEYIPGRIIAFDSRISHKVLPINRNSQTDRYSIAIKTCSNRGLDSFKKIYKTYSI